MRRYSNKELANKNVNRFAVDVLRDEAKGRDVYQPVTQKLRESIAYLHIMEETGIPYSLLHQIFCAWEATKPSRHLSAVIVFTADSFSYPYRIVSRSFVVSSDNKAFQPNTNNTSVFGSCLDGGESNVRLDAFMASGNGGEAVWKVEACYLLASDYCFPASFA